MLRGDGSLLGKGPSPNCLDLDNEETTQSMSNFRRAPTSKRSPESSPMAKGNGKEQRPSPLPS